jgi:hypothetical protein
LTARHGDLRETALRTSSKSKYDTQFAAKGEKPIALLTVVRPIPFAICFEIGLQTSYNQADARRSPMAGTAFNSLDRLPATFTKDIASLTYELYRSANSTCSTIDVDPNSAQRARLVHAHRIHDLLRGDVGAEDMVFADYLS